MEGMELLFSSDYYEEYEKDIYAVSSLPNGYYYKFRYPREYTSEFIQKNYKQRMNALALVVFVTGNKEEITNKKLKFIPIRLAIIKSISIDDDTEMFDVHFELGDFIELEDDGISLDETPLSKIFFGHQVIEPNYVKVTWRKIVEKLNGYKEALYFRIKLEDSNRNELKPAVKEDFDSHYLIDEMKDYFLKITIANLCQKKELQEIRSQVLASDLSTTLSKTIQPGLEYDNRSYKLSGLEVGDRSTRINMIKLRSYKLNLTEEDKSVYSIRLLFDVTKNNARRFGYLIWTSLLLLGTGSLITDYDEFMCLTLTAKGFSIFGWIVASIATAQLYSRFNKK